MTTAVGHSTSPFDIDASPRSLVHEPAALCSMLPTCIGHGTAAGHCGELIQVWLQHGNYMKVVLSSLPCPVYSKAKVQLNPDTREWTITPADRTKALRSAQIASHLLGYHGGGAITLASDSRVGAGLGSSGTDCKATIAAAFRACGQRPPQRETLISLLQNCGDSALDSTLLDTNCLTASRTFEVVQDFENALPRLVCVAFDSDPERTITTATTYLAPPECDSVLTRYHSLFDAFVAAARVGDTYQLGAISTACSRIGQREVYNDALDSVIAVSEAEHCLGVARSYTGTILTALLSPSDPDLIAKIRRVRSAFTQLHRARPFVFWT